MKNDLYIEVRFTLIRTFIFYLQILTSFYHTNAIIYYEMLRNRKKKNRLSLRNYKDLYDKWKKP